MAFAGQSVSEPRLPSASQRAALGRGWPREAREALVAAIKKYGWPHGISKEAAVWYYNSPWKRMVVYRRGRRHTLLKPHLDILEQAVDYFVPITRRETLAYLRPQIIYEAKRGEVMARCDSEEMNCILLNAAYEVTLGRLTVKQAQRKIEEVAAAVQRKWPEPWAEGLLFLPDLMYSDEQARILSKVGQRAI